MGNQNFQSLRFRLLVPLLAASILAAILVAAMSGWLSTRWATHNVDQRFLGIERALSQSTFPLTASVLELLADLTNTELITFLESGELFEATLVIDPQAEAQLERVPILTTSRSLNVGDRLSVNIGDRHFLAYGFQRPTQADPSRRVLVLFDQEQVAAMRRGAAMLPLVTGLSTIVLLGTLSLVLTNRLIIRLERLQRRVEFVARGNFDQREEDPVQDEIGLLASAVDSMAGQLKDLWRAVQRQQSEKLLHQVSGGMAHQLRNTLTGARLALELHARRNRGQEDEEIKVALREVQQAEGYIRRLLLVALGQQEKDRRASAMECFQDVQSSMTPTAKHLKAEVTWIFDDSLQQCDVKDGPTLIAAVTNLVLNAMQAGTTVCVTSERVNSTQAAISVIDNGPGVSEAIASEIFEPFVTSKPEGMGLGLPLVRRAAEHLEGQVQWSREGDQTVFRLLVQIFQRDKY